MLIERMTDNVVFAGLDAAENELTVVVRDCGWNLASTSGKNFTGNQLDPLSYRRRPCFRC
jgi:hypothetical protein